MIKNNEFLKKLKEKFLKIWNIPVIFSFILAFFLVGLVESLSRHNFFGGLVFLIDEPMFYLMNTLPIAAVLTLTYFVPKRVFAQFMVSFVFFAIATINCILLYTRIRPLEAVDFSIIRTGISLLTVYLNTFEIILCALAIILAIVGIVAVFMKSPKSNVNIKEAAVSSVSAITAATLVLVVFTWSGILPSSFKDMTKAYSKYGFCYCFTRSIFDRGISEPDDYGEHSVEEILKLIESEKTKEPNSKPNVIAVQLESFMDPSIIKGVDFEYNPVPNFTVLKENCTSGIVYVPSVGSGTANTEFEFITGMCLDYFGTGEYPYKTILQTKHCETLCYNLRELGYSSHAFHNHTGTFYNRNIVYQNLGFDTFTPFEYMNSYELNPLGWAKDYVLEEEIIGALRSTDESDFVFAVSVQGHGKYPEKPVEGETLISLSGIEDEGYRHRLEYYAYQLYEMDDFIGRLVRALSAFDEECILVLYGDHQPSLDYTEEDIIYGDMHASEYLIWANFKIEEKDRDLEAYQLGAYMLEFAGINNGLLTKLHQNYSESADYERALEVLEYDMLYGEMLSYKGEEDHIYHEMVIGIRDIKITGISFVGEDYYVLGENFTPSSIVYVNGKAKDTLYISSTVLLLDSYIPEAGDSITVKQVTEDFVELGETEIYSFSGFDSSDPVRAEETED